MYLSDILDQFPLPPLSLIDPVVFQVYDIDRDGRISRDDLKHVSLLRSTLEVLRYMCILLSPYLLLYWFHNVLSLYSDSRSSSLEWWKCQEGESVRSKVDVIMKAQGHLYLRFLVCRAMPCRLLPDVRGHGAASPLTSHVTMEGPGCTESTNKEQPRSGR